MLEQIVLFGILLKEGETHEEYAERMKKSKGIILGGGTSVLPSSTSGGY